MMRNNRGLGLVAPNLRSPLALVPLNVLLSSDIDDNQEGINREVRTSQRRPGSADIQWKIPRSERPVILQLVDQGESLRLIASYYRVSYEAVRRVVRAARDENG